MTDWQPMETAPWDGTRVLVACKHHITIGYQEGGWYSRACGANGCMVRITPTHWQPLPSPPKGKRQ